MAAAQRFGSLLGASRIGLVYGGGGTGLMGALARGVYDSGGEITGIVPAFLKSEERTFAKAREIIVTRGMHERKRIMFERADAFVALPGGLGTLEELVEQLTWAQLGRHRKPIVIANIAGYWSAFLALLEHMNRSGFVPANTRLAYTVVDNVDAILPALAAAAAHVPEQEYAGKPETIRQM